VNKYETELAWSLYVRLHGTVAGAMYDLARKLESDHYSELSETFIDGVREVLHIIEAQLDGEDETE
jgi:hypothetical protein